MTTAPRRSSLADFAINQDPAPAAVPTLSNVPSSEPVEAADSPDRPARRRRRVTEEIVQLGFRLPRSRWQRLHELALHDRSSVQAVVVEALEAHFRGKGLKF